jgi:OmcA/MtrC family decaheme c-type cytochrome
LPARAFGNAGKRASDAERVPNLLAHSPEQAKTGETQMPAKNSAASCLRSLRAIAAMLLAAAPVAHAQSLEWGATRYFQYNIENVVVTPTVAAGVVVAGSYDVKVIFSVTNPVAGDTWDIKSALPFNSPSANLSLDFGWDPSADVTNTGSDNPTLAPNVSTSLGRGAALPVQVRGIQAAAVACSNSLDCPGAVSLVNRYRITKTVKPVSFVSTVTRGRVAIEGRPVCNGVDPAYACPPPAGPAFVNIPVRSAVASFTFSPATPATALIEDPRRKVVDIRKCQLCHDGGKHGDVEVPRLSLHGGNRNENLGLCVVCHNPNQTDVPYRYLTAGTTADPRISGPETPIDFKTMIHSIHSGGFREKPFVVVGFNSSVVDFSGVRFPSELRNCLNCHVEVNGKGSFELPLAKTVLGTTVNTKSTYLVALGGSRSISVNPADDTKISPTAATCSACHDKAEVKSHMVKTGGASFSTTQAAIGTTVVERCANCHGPGKDRDVRRAHEIGGSGADD